MQTNNYLLNNFIFTFQTLLNKLDFKLSDSIDAFINFKLF